MNTTQIIISIITLVILNWLWDQRIIRKKLALNTPDKPNPEAIEKRRKLLFASRVILTPILAFPLIMGVWISNDWFKSYNMGIESLNWAEVTGTVIDKQVHTVRPSGSMNTSTISHEYLPLIEYEYKINEKTFTSKRINYHRDLTYTEENDVQIYLDQFPDVGEKINIYINTIKTRPAHNNIDSVTSKTDKVQPKQQSVLITGTEDMNYLSLVLTNIFTLIGLIGFKKLYL
jgi:hypothetical protein